MPFHNLNQALTNELKDYSSESCTCCGNCCCPDKVDNTSVPSDQSSNNTAPPGVDMYRDTAGQKTPQPATLTTSLLSPQVGTQKDYRTHNNNTNIATERQISDSTDTLYTGEAKTRTTTRIQEGNSNVFTAIADSTINSEFEISSGNDSDNSDNSDNSDLSIPGESTTTMTTTPASQENSTASMGPNGTLNNPEDEHSSDNDSDNSDKSDNSDFVSDEDSEPGGLNYVVNAARDGFYYMYGLFSVAETPNNDSDSESHSSEISLD